jgi:Cu(I)/Ag(I) efflux system membrane protein CusA/SilA
MRIRPKFMTVATMIIGLLPILWSTGPGSDLMKQSPLDGGRDGVVVSNGVVIYPVLI